MAKVVKKLGLPQPDGFLYFVEGDGTVWKHQGGQKTIISKSKVKREEGYLYFIDLNGDWLRRQIHSNEIRNQINFTSQAHKLKRSNGF